MTFLASIEEPDKSGGEHDLGMERVRYVINEVSVCSVRQLKSYPDCIVRRAVEAVQGVTEEMEEIASI